MGSSLDMRQVDQYGNGVGVEPTFGAERAVNKPYDFNALIAGIGQVGGGHYSAAFAYSNTAAKPTTNSPVFSARWTDAQRMMVLLRLSMRALVTTLYTAAGAQDMAAYRVSGWTGADSGGTQPGLALTQNRVRNNMPQSSLFSTGGIWLSSGDTLTAGTRVVETNPFGWAGFFNSGTVGGGNVQAQELYNALSTGKHPLIFGLNEGLVIQSPIGNAQAAGVSKWMIEMDWLETPAF